MSASKFVLYGGRFTRAVGTEMVMLEGDIDYEMRVVEIMKNEHRSPEFLKINPAGWIPVLITPEGETLYETPAINLHLIERHQLTDLAPMVDDPDRAAFLCAMFYVTDELEPIMKRYFFPHRYVVRREDTAEMKRMATESAIKCLKVIEGRMQENGPYSMGGRFSLVDILIAFWACVFGKTDHLEELPAVAKCIELVRARPKLTPKFEQLEAWRAEYAGIYAKAQGLA